LTDTYKSTNTANASLPPFPLTTYTWAVVDDASAGTSMHKDHKDRETENDSPKS